MINLLLHNSFLTYNRLETSPPFMVFKLYHLPKFHKIHPSSLSQTIKISDG